MSLHDVSSAPQSAVGSSDDVSGRVANNKSCRARAQNSVHWYARKIYLQQVFVLAFVLGVLIQTGTTLHDIVVHRQELTRIETLVISVMRDEMHVRNNQKIIMDIMIRYHSEGNKSGQIPSEHYLTELRRNTSAVWTKVDNAIFNEVKAGYKGLDESGMWRYLITIKNILESLQYFMNTSEKGLNYLKNRTLYIGSHIRWIGNEGFTWQLLHETLYLSTTESLLKLEVLATGEFQFRDEVAILEERPWNPEEIRSYSEGYIAWITEFFKSAVQVQTNLIYLTDAIIRKKMNSTLQEARRKEATCIGILVIVIIISLIIIVLVLKAVATIQAYAIDLMQKTAALEDEREKSDHLLLQMLPPLVAQQLKQTQQIPAEYYEAVTIYFSDIVGFTEFAAENTPLKVVKFLNSIYILFDMRIECYDVYKIETIGDSCMVVSGLPVKNDDKHVPEIATMALDLLDISSGLEIPERSSEYLRIRSGIHTGPVMAGIVGRKMPRYCLFGDTVNTASRMESTGEALRIQISWETKEALDAVGGFHMVDRGLVDVKGKGPMYTFWLEGKSGGIMRAGELDLSTFFLNDLPPFMQQLRKAESTVGIC